MSSNIPAVNVTGAIAGQQFLLDFTAFVNVDPSNKEPAHLRVYNESGCGVSAQFNSSGRQEFIPAGAWPTFDLEFNDSSITFTVAYVLPNPPVSSINAVYYAPHEAVPKTPQLGNSPIGIGGNVQTSSITTLSNEGSAGGLLVIDMGDTAFNQLIAIYNDGHALWAVDQSGVKHQVINIQTSGNPLQLGQALDITEVLGNLTVDGTSILTGNVSPGAHIIMPNATSIQIKDSVGTPQHAIIGNASNHLQLQAIGAFGLIDFISTAGALAAQFNADNPADSLFGTLALQNTGQVFNATSGGQGNATLYQPLVGTGLKLVMVKLNANFQNGSSVLNVTLPTAFTKFAIYAFVDFPGFSLMLSGVAQGGSIISAWDNPSTIVGSVTSFTQIGNLAVTGAGFDTVQISSNNANPKNGVLLLIGV